MSVRRVSAVAFGRVEDDVDRRAVIVPRVRQYRHAESIVTAELEDREPRVRWVVGRSHLDVPGVDVHSVHGGITVLVEPQS